MASRSSVGILRTWVHGPRSATSLAVNTPPRAKFLWQPATPCPGSVHSWIARADPSRQSGARRPCPGCQLLVRQGGATSNWSSCPGSFLALIVATVVSQASKMEALRTFRFLVVLGAQQRCSASELLRYWVRLVLAFVPPSLGDVVLDIAAGPVRWHRGGTHRRTGRSGDRLRRQPHHARRSSTGSNR